MSMLLGLLDVRPPHWSGNVIERWDNDRFNRLESFATSYLWTDSGTLNVFRVGWMRETYRPAIVLHRAGSSDRPDAAAAKRLIAWLEGPWFTRLFRAWPLP